MVKMVSMQFVAASVAHESNPFFIVTIPRTYFMFLFFVFIAVLLVGEVH